MAQINFSTPLSPLTAAKALVALYRRQTADEQAAGNTVYQNDVGFNGADAGFCSSVAQQLLAGRPLTDKQLAVLQRILPKYYRQLAEVDLDRIELPPRGADIPVPWSERPATKEEPKTAGTLQLTDQGLLEFVPRVYPTTQLKAAGWKRGSRSQWTWVKEVSLEQYNTVLRHWPDTTITPEVQQLIVRLTAVAQLPPEIEEHQTLFPFQKESIQFLTSHPRAMLALAPGLGKTACSTFAAELHLQHTTGKVLIVAPLTLTTTWRREIRKWVDQESTILHGKAPYSQPEHRWVITNYDTVRLNLEWFTEQEWALVILDESVMLKNRKAKRTQSIKTLTSKVPVVWHLSGAPTTRFYDDLWAQLNILAPKRFSSYWRFTESYCLIHHSEWGINIIGNQPDSVGRLQQDLADIYFSRTQDQVLNLPPWIFETIEVPMSSKQWQTYKEMDNRFWTELPEGDVLLAPNVLAQLTRLIQLASNPLVVGGADTGGKWAAVTEMLEWVQKPVVIWTSYIETANQMRQRLRKAGHTAELLTGETSQAARTQIVDNFQSGELDIIIAHPGVGKFGLTLTRARTAIYLERGYSGDDYFQSLHRVRRIGTQHSPVVYHLLASGPDGQQTVDHVIDRVLRFRKDSALAITTSLLRGEE